MSVHVAPLADRARLRLGGAGWRGFLNGLITASTLEPAAGGLAYGALLAPQGRLLHDLFLFEADDHVVLDVAAAGRDDLAARLRAYRLRVRVDIDPDPGGVEAAWGGTPPGAGWRADPRAPGLGWRRLAEGAAAAADPEAAEAYRRRRLDLGILDPAGEGDPADYPIELNFDLLGAIDFHKGCFIGQETTSRMRRRGTVRSRVVPLRVEGPPPPRGAEVLAGELRAGEVRASAPGRALALLRLDRSAGALAVGGRPAVLDPPPWLAPALADVLQPALPT